MSAAARAASCQQPSDAGIAAVYPVNE